ncbi:MAG: hypothetical protein IPK69_05020 [Phycisphaerales bacterium]|nr:MAG: hypothetical protein IPK69_05020 [Phycisphaerales bacterium]
MSKQHYLEKFEFTPGRVDAAMDYIRHCMWLTDPISFCDFGNKGRALTPPEQATYLAALDALRQYFNAEMDFGGPPTRLPDEDEPARKKKGRKKASADVDA